MLMELDRQKHILHICSLLVILKSKKNSCYTDFKRQILF